MGNPEGQCTKLDLLENFGDMDDRGAHAADRMAVQLEQFAQAGRRQWRAAGLDAAWLAEAPGVQAQLRAFDLEGQPKPNDLLDAIEAAVRVALEALHDPFCAAGLDFLGFTKDAGERPLGKTEREEHAAEHFSRSGRWFRGKNPKPPFNGMAPRLWLLHQIAHALLADTEPHAPQTTGITDDIMAAKAINKALHLMAVDRPLLHLEAEHAKDSAGLVLASPQTPSLALPIRDVSDLVGAPEQTDIAFLREVLRRTTDWPSPGALADPITFPKLQGVSTQRDSHVLELIQRHPAVTLVGPSASGKTYTAMHIASHLEAFGWTVSLIDAGSPSAGIDWLLLQLLTTSVGHAKRHLFVVDNVQGNPGLARATLEAATQFASAIAAETRYLSITWPSGLPLVKLAQPAAHVVQCHGDDVLTALAQSTGNAKTDLTDDVRELCGGDVLIGRLSFEHHETYGALPTAHELASAAFREITGSQPISEECLALLYEIAVLGQFEVEVARTYAGRNNPKALQELIDLKVIRLSGSFVTVGHKTLAALVAAYAGAQLGDVPGPVKVVVDYLKAAGDAQLVATLERLDLVKLSRTSKDQHGSAFLANAWQSARALTRYVAHQTRSDPTWGDNLASAIFAAEPLARFDGEAWHRIADYVHNRWEVPHDSPLPRPVDQASAERIDFDEIARRMADEDSRRGSGMAITAADKIDLDLTHRTWVLGLLLGFEASAPQPDATRIHDLVMRAAAIQEPEGFFYPARIPWVTARVLLGLAAAGESIHTSQTVRDACDWLCRPYPHGPCQFGVWESGTGTWNTPTMTSAMCLLALVKSGMALGDPIVRSANAYLSGKRDTWRDVGRELDAAEVLQVLLISGNHWTSVRNDLVRLLQWARDREAWSTALASAAEVQDESSKVPSIAGSLIRLVWTILNSDISLLMEGVAMELSNRLLKTATAAA